jgi:pentalenene oxygenase
MTLTNATKPRAPATLPHPLPLLGHAVALWRDPWAFLAAARDAGPVTAVRLGPQLAYLVNDPELIRRVLVTDVRTFEKGVQFDKLRPVLGNGLVTARGPEHLRHRRLIQPAFHASRIAGYAEVMRRLTNTQTQKWRDGSRVDLDRELAELTLRVVAQAMFNTDLGTEVVDEVLRSIPVMLAGITKRALSPIPLLEKLPTKANREFDAANRRLRAVVERIVGEYRRAGVDHGDMVSMLLLARDDETGAGLDDEQIRDEVITMLVAGTETSANVLCWALHVLGQQPLIEARLHAEVDAVVTDDGPTIDQVGRLGYVRRLITEVLRLYPPGWLTMRRTTQPVTLGAQALPAGASVLFSPYALHRDPTIYRDPEVFDPDRWLPERAAEIPRPAFIPFSAGTRQCVGEGFAWTETVLILAALTRHWRFVPVPDVPVRMVASGTLTPSALPMFAHRRSAPDPR